MSINNVANFVIAIICLGVGLVMITLSTVYYFRHRKERILDARSIFMAVVSNILISTFLISECVNVIVAELGYHDAVCVITDIVINIHLQALLNLYLLRAWMLLCKFEITTKIANMRNHRESLFDGLGGWLIEHRIVLTVKFLFIVHLLTVGVEVLATVFLSLGNGCISDVNTIYQISFGVMQLFPLVIMSLRLSRHGQDAYGIKNEFLAAACAWILAALSFCIFHFWAFDHNGFGEQMSYILLLLTLFSINTFWPLHLVRTGNKSTEFQVNDITTLSGLLENPEGYELFAKYLAREFAQENLMLWTAVNQYRKDAVLTAHLNPQKCVALLEGIRDKYMVTDAPYEVNLPYTPKMEFMNALVAMGGSPVASKESSKTADISIQPTPTPEPLLKDAHSGAAQTNADVIERLLHILDRIQREVTDLLMHDSLPRFLQSSEFQVFKAAHQAKANAGGANSATNTHSNTITDVTANTGSSAPHRGSTTTKNSQHDHSTISNGSNASGSGGGGGRGEERVLVKPLSPSSSGPSSMPSSYSAPPVGSLATIPGSPQQIESRSIEVAVQPIGSASNIELISTAPTAQPGRMSSESLSVSAGGHEQQQQQQQQQQEQHQEQQPSSDSTSRPADDQV